MRANDVKIIDPLSDARWDSFVTNHQHGTIYQHSCWIRVIARTHDHVRPLCFIIEDESCNIRSAIPCFIVKSGLTGTRIVSLPFSSYCDPLVADEGDLTRLLDRMIVELGSIPASYYELRAFRRVDLLKESRLKPHSSHKIHILDISGGFENVKQGFHRDCIVRSVKKAERCGVTVRQGCSEEDLKRFYAIHARTRKHQGFPIQPYRFFKNMWEMLYPQGYFTVLLAELDEKPIAGIVLFKFRDTVSFEHGASIAKYLSVRPNHLALWAGIEMACCEGYQYFDFGKTTSDNKGLLEFKTRWGAKMYDLPYFYYPEIKGAMSLELNDLKYRLFRAVQRHMPLSLAKTIGKMAYRHLG